MGIVWYQYFEESFSNNNWWPAKKDKLVLLNLGDGQFSIRDRYRAASSKISLRPNVGASNSFQVSTKFWRDVWSSYMPQKIKVFI